MSQPYIFLSYFFKRRWRGGGGGDGLFKNTTLIYSFSTYMYISSKFHYIIIFLQVKLRS